MSRPKSVDADLHHALALGSRWWTFGSPVVGIDPGSRSMGWCTAWPTPRGVRLSSGQGTPPEMLVAVRKSLRLPVGSGPFLIALLCIEAPSFMAQGRSNPGSAWILPWTAGEIRGRLAQLQHDEAALWVPPQQTVRSRMGLPQHSKAKRKGDRVVPGAEEEALALARRYGQVCLDDDGNDEVDRAMACLVALAGVSEIVSLTPEDPPQKG